MKRYVQILWGKAHWIFEAEEQPEFAPDIVIVDITDKPEVKEGWEFNPETGEFTEPIVPEPEPTPEPVDQMSYFVALQEKNMLNTEYLVIMSELQQFN